MAKDEGDEGTTSTRLYWWYIALPGPLVTAVASILN